MTYEREPVGWYTAWDEGERTMPAEPAPEGPYKVTELFEEGCVYAWVVNGPDGYSKTHKTVQAAVADAIEKDVAYSAGAAEALVVLRELTNQVEAVLSYLDTVGSMTPQATALVPMEKALKAAREFVERNSHA